MKNVLAHKLIVGAVCHIGVAAIFKKLVVVVVQIYIGKRHFEVVFEHKPELNLDLLGQINVIVIEKGYVAAGGAVDAMIAGRTSSERMVVEDIYNASVVFVALHNIDCVTAVIGIRRIVIDYDNLNVAVGLCKHRVNRPV